MKFVTYSIVDVSTSHITEADAEKLTAGGNRANYSFGGMIAAYREGFFLYLSGGGVDKKEMMDEGFSHSLYVLCRKVELEGFNYIRLDRDGEMYDELEQHDW